MGNSYGSPRFAGAESLLFYLDAKIADSYPGSGDTWYDLSGNGRHGIKGGSEKPSWDPSGYFIFTGGVTANNYTRFDIPVPNIPNGAMSFFLTFRSNQVGSRIARMSSDDFNLSLTTNGVYGGAGDTYADAVATYTDAARNVGWHYLGITFDGKFTKLYYDGIYRTQAMYAKPGNASITGGTLRLGTRNDAYLEHYIGDISMIHLHNAVLTPEQIRNNYTRCRIGGHV